MSAEKADDETRERAIAAAGMVKAADLLAGEYTLVITNVPYLGRGKHRRRPQGLIADEHHCQDAKPDLATRLRRSLPGLLLAGGTSRIVTPQNWLFLTTYTRFAK